MDLGEICEMDEWSVLDGLTSSNLVSHSAVCRLKIYASQDLCCHIRQEKQKADLCRPLRWVRSIWPRLSQKTPRTGSVLPTLKDATLIYRPQRRRS